MVLPWDPMEVARWHQLAADDGWWIAGSVADTRPGERAAVYRTKRDQGLAGFFDFSSRAFRHPDLGWAAFGRPAPLPREVARGELLSVDELAAVFSSLRGRRRLPDVAAQQLATMVGAAPEWQAARVPLPDPDYEDWRWTPARQDGDWGIEAAMRDALCAHETSWRKLGFSSVPQRETYAPGSRLRMDLYGPGVIGECKLVAGLSTLGQLDRYLALQRAAVQGQRWKGHIIIAFSYTDRLAAAVFEREDLQMWLCRRSHRGHPELAEITRQRPLPT